jgi:hypothetical protein
MGEGRLARDEAGKGSRGGLSRTGS